MPRLGYGRFASVIGIMLLSLWVAPGARAGRPQPVSVRSVTFNEARLPSQKEPYYEIAIRLRGERVTDAGGESDFYRAIDVRLELGFVVGRGEHERQEFYRSRAQLVGLSVREEKTVYFYLPPEIVRRDRLSRAPVAWRVSLGVNGEALRHEPGSYSGSLGEVSAARLFMSRMERHAPRNDGLLLPIYLTPFYSEQARRLEESPSYMRSDPLNAEDQEPEKRSLD